MKPKLLFFALLFSYALSNAQTTAIPDANFEQALIDLGYDAAPINGSVPTAQIDFIELLDISNKNISDLTGIMDFASLRGLDCNGNQIGSLNLSNNSILISLNCAGNNLSHLNVKNGNNINFINFKVVENPNLTCIEVDDAAYSTANWSGGIDSQMSFSEDCYTAIPDANFEQALIDLGYDAVLDGFVTTANIETLTTLIVSSKNIRDLTGIEDFTALTYLYCYSNALTSLDVSANTALTGLYCYSNALTSLDVSANTALTDLYCSSNALTSLDVSANTALTTLKCFNNALTSLDVSANTALTDLYCHSNALTSLDVSANTALTDLYCNSNALTSLDVSANTALTGLYCNSNALTSLDVSANTALTSLYCYSNALTSLDVSANTALTDLYCGSNALTSLDVSANTALTGLYCSSNALTSLDVKNGNNTNVTSFSANYNPNLFCIEVDDEAYSTTNWTNIDAQTSFNEDCHYGDTYVPDDNFEQALIDLGYDAGPLDDYVPTANIINVTTLPINNKNIADLTGIEAFEHLSVLDCSSNQITTLDLSNNTYLTEFNCAGNNLHELNIKNNKNTHITLFKAVENPNLTCIEVDDPAYSTTNWQAIDAQTSFNIDCRYDDTYVPDDNFEQALIDLGYDAGPLDDYVPTDNINILTTLNVSSKNISDLTGIEDFVALEELDCSLNQLTSLDVSANTALTYLNCGSNALTSLNVSQNTSLAYLRCHDNQITSIDVSHNLGLIEFVISINQLTSLDVSHNTALTTLLTHENQLTYLDVSLNTALNDFTCSNNQLTSLNVKNGNNTNFTQFFASDNPNLTCIEVDDAAYSTTNWTNIDAQTSFSEDCSAIPLTYVPDDNFEQALIDLGYDSGALDDYVPTDNINTITALDVHSKNISDLTGIEDFTALEELDCSDNQLTSLDVSQNTALMILMANFNQLTSLDVTQNTTLTTLWVGHNQLTSINLSQNTGLYSLSLYNNQLATLDLSQFSNLIYFVCVGNQLTSLNVKNGNNTNVTTFNASNNPNLFCIEVDDAAYSTTNWTNIDAQSSFSEDCSASQLTYVPDDNFEQALIDLGYDSGALDDYVPTDNINTITALDVHSKNISDLTGIEDFTSLTSLTAYSNQLTSIDVSQNTALVTLFINLNQITSIDLSNQLALTSFGVSGNNISDLDLSLNTNLTFLVCEGLPILTSLNVKNGNNTNITHFKASNNPNLFCIEVDDANYSTTNWTFVDAQTSFSEDCSANIVTLSPKLFLQGPLLSPVTPGYMDDILRQENLLPTTSPYADTATCDASVFNVTGNNAIVDWVWIELRDANDNTSVVAARSALIQRDGDVVEVDGTSPVSVETAPADYYLMVSHRNHLGVLTNSAISLSGTNTVIDLTNNINLINGGTNGIATMNDGKLALFAGDFNGDGQVQNSDKSAVETLRGSNGYSDADIDMNSEVQNSDIQSYLNPNTGKGIQFSRTVQLKLYAKRNKH